MKFELQDRPLIDLDILSFLAAYDSSRKARQKAGLSNQDYKKYLVLAFSVHKPPWKLVDDETAYQLVLNAARTEYLDPAIDYLIEKGMPDWATELLRSVK